jgi:hypothetical protein
MESIEPSNETHSRHLPPTLAGLRARVGRSGAGGKTHDGFRKVRRNRQGVRNTGTFGVLALTLRPASYDRRFLPEPGKTYHDHDHDRCRRARLQRRRHTPGYAEPRPNHRTTRNCAWPTRQP